VQLFESGRPNATPNNNPVQYVPSGQGYGIIDPSGQKFPAGQITGLAVPRLVQ